MLNLQERTQLIEALKIAVTSDYTEDLAQKCIESIDGAISSRGPLKGYLKKKAPTSSHVGAAAYQALQSIANMFKVSVWSMIAFNNEQKGISNAIHHSLAKRTELMDRVPLLDKDRAALGSIGAW